MRVPQEVVGPALDALLYYDRISSRVYAPEAAAQFSTTAMGGVPAVDLSRHGLVPIVGGGQHV